MLSMTWREISARPGHEEDWEDWKDNSRRGATFIPRDPEARPAILPATSSTRILNPRFLSQMASHNVAKNVCQAHCLPRHQHAFRTLAFRFKWHPMRCRAISVRPYPETVYAEHGWTGWPEWLGTPLPFEAARGYARSLGLRTQQVGV